MAALGAPNPGVLAGFEIAKRGRDRARRQLSDLMAADARAVLDRGQPLLLIYAGRYAVLAVELAVIPDLHHRIPVNRRIVLGGSGFIGRPDGGEVEMLTRLAIDVCGINKAVAAYPDLVFGFRQGGQHVAAAIVGNHPPRET